MWNRVVKWRYRCGGQRGEANWRVFVNKRIAATSKESSRVRLKVKRERYQVVSLVGSTPVTKKQKIRRRL